ncbi:hypothetical protein QV65_31980 [Rhodococcus erythropolis]|nr:hypothetical protein QV65_31980 [Rhodococcus erythropolis]
MTGHNKNAASTPSAEAANIEGPATDTAAAPQCDTTEFPADEPTDVPPSEPNFTAAKDNTPKPDIDLPCPGKVRRARRKNRYLTRPPTRPARSLHPKQPNRT